MNLRTQRALYVLAYYLSWGWFAAVALLLNAVCAPLVIVPGGRRAGARVRVLIRLLFNLWRCWFHASGVVRLTWEGFDRPLPAGTVYVANHPTLVDATLVLAKLPDAICMMKAALMRNPAVAPAAIVAGYVCSEPPLDAVHEAAVRVAAGCSLLIFPEGTRTPPGARVGPVRSSFALIAERARAPVQLIVIRASPGLAPKGRAWWRPPTVLPGWMTFTLDRRWEWDERRPTGDLVAEVRARMEAASQEA